MTIGNNGSEYRHQSLGRVYYSFQHNYSLWGYTIVWAFCLFLLIWLCAHLSLQQQHRYVNCLWKRHLVHELLNDETTCLQLKNQALLSSQAPIENHMYRVCYQRQLITIDLPLPLCSECLERNYFPNQNIDSKENPFEWFHNDDGTYNPRFYTSSSALHMW